MTALSATTRAIENDDEIVISYDLQHGPRTSFGRASGNKKEPTTTKIVVPWSCTGTHPHLEDVRSNKRTRVLLYDEMRPYFNFTITNFRSNLNILIMGDSRAIQISDYLQDIIRLDYDYDNDVNNDVPDDEAGLPIPPSEPSILKKALGMGRSAYSIQVTTHIPRPARGWHRVDVQKLNDHVRLSTAPSATTSSDVAEEEEGRTFHVMKANDINNDNNNITNNKNTTKETGGVFDVFIFRIPSPSWIPLEEVSLDALQDTVELAYELFGAQIVIFITMDYNNNVMSREHWDEMKRRNQMVLDFAYNWTVAQKQTKTATETNNGQTTMDVGHGVHTVYALDSAKLLDGMLEWNARLIGFDTTNETTITDSSSIGDYHYYTDQKLKSIDGRNGKVTYMNTVAQMCAEKVPLESSECIRNAISLDGMHQCMNIVGPRIVAGLACQIQCAYRSSDSSLSSKPDNGAGKKSWSCAQSCNDRFMSPLTIP